MGEKCPEDLQAINQITGLMFQFLRERAGLSVSEVADYLEVHDQELEDHESGVNPLSTARLYHAGQLFGVKVSAFFQPYYNPGLFE